MIEECDWVEFDLDAKLIGFHARMGEYPEGPGTQNIRSIALITDNQNCEEAVFWA